MWIVTKEDLILIGVILAIGVVAVLALLQPRPDPVPVVVQPPAQVLTKPEEPTAEQTPAIAIQQPRPEPAPGPSAAASLDGMIVAGEYAHQTEAGGFEVYWSNDAWNLRVGLMSPGAGYVAIGFDPDDGMAGANFILGAVRAGRLVMRDDYGISATLHAPDTSVEGTTDILGAAGSETASGTCIEFVIPLDSGDQADKRLVPGHTYAILVAYHDTDDDFNMKHTRRGSGTIRLDLPG